ncbi:hypothetical protein CFC21_112340 [Triticum aestivum]|uniref:Uncharacterized protein n=2 Tax=Triticum aestivum TaxID=4565 RepID=A0A3B6U335_WHEAT|nr:uncharacterized protein LOC123124499 [Triticum aestivum]MBC2899508.1 hypothetical protein [Triticum aestivum]
MLAVRCAARRLGGSQLQRTQAAVAQEGRRLVPSGLMRSRQLSTKHACETWMQKKMQKLRYMWAQHKADIERRMREHPEKDEFKLLVESYARTIDGVIHGTAKMALLFLVPFGIYASYTKEGVEAQAVTKGDQ